MFSPNKPVPYRLSQFGSCREVLYKCPKCGADFRILADQENYCHNCGIKLDWTTSKRVCSEEFKEQYDKLVYEENAYTSGKRPQDQQLVNLLYQFYCGKIS